MKSRLYIGCARALSKTCNGIIFTCWTDEVEINGNVKGSSECYNNKVNFFTKHIFCTAAEHSMWVAWKSIRESTPWSQAVKPHMDIMGALTMAGHESGSTKQLKSCGNINIKSRAERTDGCLLRQKKRERKKCGHWQELKMLANILKKEKEGNSGSCVGPCLAPTPTPDGQAS